MTKNILIVDDSTSFRQVVSMTLLDAGYAVTQACDGKDALTKLNGQRYHLIVSDVNMPHMDGLQLLKAIKAHATYKFTPVLMLTTESAQAKMADAKASGAKAWITKPFQPPQFLDAVSRLVMA